MNIKIAAAGGIAALLFLSGCSSDSDEATAPTTSAAVESEMASEAPAAEAPGTIVDVASANSDFETLVAAVTAADLVETLAGEGPYTVFAPTDDAFDALPEGLLDALLLPENKDALTSILTYHVVSGKVMAADVTAGDVPDGRGLDHRDHHRRWREGQRRQRDRDRCRRLQRRDPRHRRRARSRVGRRRVPALTTEHHDCGPARSH